MENSMVFGKCSGCRKDITLENYKKFIGHLDGTIERICKSCLSGNSTAVPDVWYGYGSGIHTEENICDPKTGQPIPFYDKTSKAAAMKQAKVREIGDRVRGARNEDSLKRKTYFT